MARRRKLERRISGVGGGVWWCRDLIQADGLDPCVRSPAFVTNMALLQLVRVGALRLLAGLMEIRVVWDPAEAFWIGGALVRIGQRRLILGGLLWTCRLNFWGLRRLGWFGLWCRGIRRGDFLAVRINPYVLVLVDLLYGSEALSGRHLCGKLRGGLDRRLAHAQWQGEARTAGDAKVLDKLLGCANSTRGVGSLHSSVVPSLTILGSDHHPTAPLAPVHPSHLPVPTLCF